ncbi:hypothetical protein JTE90_028171 [Oedothorax gibbosus]|uniref:Transposase n=1 Tax=Oedothorax gibbosus TaxID=931172 RepID=A0AAV6VAR4_9ARAC|nr:hypothetical protein JTE90_028171 [Oedothorax gibbosus]
MEKHKAGQRLIVVHASNENGSVEGASLVFKSGTASGDYHGQINFDNFFKWVEEKLLPNIPPNSVIYMVNTSYHTKVLDPVPSKYSTKKKPIELLMEKNIVHNPNTKKTELYD